HPFSFMTFRFSSLSTLFPYTTLFRSNAEAYLETLREIDQEYKDKISDIPEENRILVTSERAYQYMAHSYGLEEYDFPLGYQRFRSEEHTSELQSRFDLVCRLLLEQKK